jgi:hypothetical protein
MERHRATEFYLVDECLAPASMRRISQRLIDSQLEVRWMADVRYERALTPELLTLARRSGCRLLAFGLESANDRVLNLMRKGTNREVSQRVLNQCHEAGIASNVMLFIGFPSETEEEAWQTLQFILENRSKVDMVSLGTFQLNRNARMCDVAAAVGLELRQTPPECELTDFHRYRVASGMSEIQASRLEEVFLRRLQSEGYDYPLLSRTHALLIDRGLFGFTASAASQTGTRTRPALAREFEVQQRRYRVGDIRAAVARVREHLRREALENLREAEEAIRDCQVQVRAHPAVVLASSDIGDWAVDVSQTDLDSIPSILDAGSLSRLSSEPGGLERLLRAMRLERLGVLRWLPEEAAWPS